MLGVPAFASDDFDEDAQGKLRLNTTVLVNDSVGAGVRGDFAIRGSLFSENLYAKIQEQRDTAVAQLRAARAINFTKNSSKPVDYTPVRAALFQEYSPHKTVATLQEKNERAAAFYLVATVLVIPLVLVAGVLLGKFWGKRKRAVS